MSVSLKSFTISDLTLKYLIHFKFCISCQTRVKFHSFACGYPVFSPSFTGKTFLSPLRILVKDYLPICA
jgi:hypothetical protein